MRIHVTFPVFRDAFASAGRAGRFSERGLEALYNYLLELEQDNGEETELDVLDICCDWEEYTPDRLLREFGSPACTELPDVVAEVWDQTHIVEADNGNYIVLMSRIDQ